VLLERRQQVLALVLEQEQVLEQVLEQPEPVLQPMDL
jgi:hypothetical protein